MKPLVVKKGQIIKFDVKYGGEPEPEASWELEGKPVKIDGERYILLCCYSTHTDKPTLLKINHSSRVIPQPSDNTDYD